MKKIIFSFLILACIFTISGCEKEAVNNITDNSTTIENKPLKIERVYTTSIFPEVINKDDYENTNFYANSSTIDVFFNQDIVDNNYTLGFFSGGKYYAVKNEYDVENYVFYKYTIEKNKLIIKPIENYHQYGTIEALYIPSTITTFNDIRLLEDKLFLMSQFENDDIHFSINDKFELDEQRNVYSQSIAKYKNDGNNLAFLNNNDSYIYSNSSEASSTLKVYKGENVIIKDETDTMYLVEIYFNNIDGTSTFNKDFKTTESNEFDVVEGYIKKSNLTMVEEPYNDNIYYLVKTIYFNDMGLCEFYIDFSVVNDYFGAESLKIGDNISKIDKSDLYILECLTLAGWINGYYDNFPKSFFSSVSNLNSEIPKLDKNAHMPELAWSEDDYNSYVKAVGFYNNYLINFLKRNKVVDELSGFMDDLLYKIKTITVLQELWIDWGYKNKLENENYMFEEIFKMLNLSEEQNIELKNIFTEATNEIEELKKTTTMSSYDIQNMLFDKKLYSFYNNYGADILQFGGYFGEMMLKKYYKREKFESTAYEQMKIDAVTYKMEQLTP